MKYLNTILFIIFSTLIYAQGSPTHISLDSVEIATYDHHHFRKPDKKAGRRIGPHTTKAHLYERVDFTLDYSYENYYLIVSTKEIPALKIDLKRVISDKVNYTKWHAYNMNFDKPWSKNYVYINSNNNELVFDFSSGIFRYYSSSNTRLCKSDLIEDLETSISNLEFSYKYIDNKARKTHNKAHKNERSTTCEAVYYAAKHHLKIPTNRKKVQMILEEKENRRQAYENSNDKQFLYALINKKLLK